MHTIHHFRLEPSLRSCQGLDLAIPDPQIYLGSQSISQENFGTDIASSLKKCPPSNSKLRFEQVSRQDFLNCRRIHLTLETVLQGALRFELLSSNDVAENWTFTTSTRSSEASDFVVWMSGQDVDSSEAACAKHRKTGISKCATRILRSTQDSMTTHAEKDHVRTNVLVVLLDPMSRNHFQETMPQTQQALEELGFIQFSNFTAVGPNSGPNQAALYSGRPLLKRNGIQPDINGQWLWDRLRKSGYATLKAEDNCVLNSNMIQSMQPNTTHGMELQGLFCFDAFSRPNCIGEDPASELLLTYGEQFMSTYERQGRNDQTTRWASFLHLTDSHEDTKLLAASLDQPLSSFLRNMHRGGLFDYTTVIVSSDHGLHYGPLFPTKSGRREATQPILHMRIPPSLQTKSTMVQMRRNARLFTTPFDLHETLLHVSQTEEIGESRLGQSLMRDLPGSRQNCATSVDTIPEAYCKLQRDDETMEQNHLTPSMASFFLDIQPKFRPLLRIDPDCRDVTAENSGTSLQLCRSVSNQ